MELVGTKTTVNTYGENDYIPPGFIDILFENQGTSIVVVNGRLINPGDSYADNSSGYNQINNTKYQVVFQPGGINTLVVTTKRYELSPEQIQKMMI